MRQTEWLKCIKVNFGWGSALDPAGESSQCSPTSLARSGGRYAAGEEQARGGDKKEGWGM